MSPPNLPSDVSGHERRNKTERLNVDTEQEEAALDTHRKKNEGVEGCEGMVGGVATLSFGLTQSGSKVEASFGVFD